MYLHDSSILVRGELVEYFGFLLVSCLLPCLGTFLEAYF